MGDEVGKRREEERMESERREGRNPTYTTGRTESNEDSHNNYREMENGIAKLLDPLI